MYNKSNGTCPQMYECSKIKMVPMIRALRRCSADEAMQSVCANCEEKPQTVVKKRALVKPRS